MKSYQRSVRFHEVDAAGLVFYPNFLLYTHESMEAFFDELTGGYAGLILARRVGLPAVRLETDFLTPLRYGDSFLVETHVEELGRRSFTLRHDLRRLPGPPCAVIRHVAVTTDLDRLESCAMPADVRALLERHLAGTEATTAG